MIRRIVRQISQYKSPQKFSEFAASSTSLPLRSAEVPLESMNRKALTFRNMDLEDYDFETETSDFDTERFSFKEYFWSCVYYREKTLIKLTSFMLIWSVIAFLSKILFVAVRKLKILLSPIGYFGLLEPAYNDIELLRYKQRLKLSVLHSYD